MPRARAARPRLAVRTRATMESGAGAVPAAADPVPTSRKKPGFRIDWATGGAAIASRNTATSRRATGGATAVAPASSLACAIRTRSGRGSRGGPELDGMDIARTQKMK